MPRDVLSSIKESRIIAIIRGVPSADILDVSRALLEGGIRCQEITFSHDGEKAAAETLESIRLVKSNFGDDILPGAGTVMTVKEAELAAEAGAEYIISPNTNVEVIKRTKKLGLVSMPGAFSPSEIAAAFEAGADIVKVFPAKSLGPEYFKAVKSTLSHIPLFAVGGINAANIADYISAGALGAGVGGNLVSLSAIKEKNFGALIRSAKELIAALP